MTEEKNSTQEESYLFAPLDDRPLKVQYPELKGIKEFVTLTDADMNFVWYYSCLSSPIIHLDDSPRLQAALKIAYQGTGQSGKIDKFRFGNIADEAITVAIPKMSSFSPSLRIGGKKLLQLMYNQLSVMLGTVTDAELKVMDSDDKSKHISFLTKANEELPKIIHNLEEGFGVKEVKGKDKKNLQSANLMDMVLSQEK